MTLFDLANDHFNLHDTMMFKNKKHFATKGTLTQCCLYIMQHQPTGTYKIIQHGDGINSNFSAASSGFPLKTTIIKC